MSAYYVGTICGVGASVLAALLLVALVFVIKHRRAVHRKMVATSTPREPSFDAVDPGKRFLKFKKKMLMDGDGLDWKSYAEKRSP